MRDDQSPETYIGYGRGENFASPGGAAPDASHVYATGDLRLNEWGLAGDWTIGEEQAALDREDGAIAYKFHARDLHLVLGPGADGKPVRFRVTIDGAPPGDSHGADIDAAGRRRRDERTSLSARSPERRDRRSPVLDPVSRSRRSGLRFHVRLTKETAS